MIQQALRQRIVQAYESDLSGTYAETAELFGVGEATVSRLLRRYRETGSVAAKKVGGNNPRRVDLSWLERHAQEHPDGRLGDRIEAWFAKSGRRVASSTMSQAMRAIGWTYKKKRLSPLSKSAKT